MITEDEYDEEIIEEVEYYEEDEVFIDSDDDSISGPSDMMKTDCVSPIKGETKMTE